jgi:hypothetical protein
MISRAGRLGLNLVMFSKLLGTTTIGIGFLTFLSVYKGNLKLNRKETSFIGAVLFQLLLSVTWSNSVAAVTNTLFYFSFLVVYIFLKDKARDELITFLKYFILIMFGFSLIEFIVFNSFASNWVWYFPEDHVHRSSIMGLQRAQGLAAISSSSGAVAVLSLALYLVVSSKKLLSYEVITFISIACLMSGTGFFLFVCYQLLKSVKKSHSILKRITLFGLTILTILLALSIFQEIELNRFTSKYFLDIYDIKINMYDGHEIHNSFVSVIFGGQSNIRDPIIVTSSDFAIIGLFESMGIYSVLLIVSGPIWLVGFQRQFLIVLILYWASWLHYPAMGSPVGTVFLGMFLALCKNFSTTVTHHSTKVKAGAPVNGTAAPFSIDVDSQSIKTTL